MNSQRFTAADFLRGENLNRPSALLFFNDENVERSGFGAHARSLSRRDGRGFQFGGGKEHTAGLLVEGHGLRTFLGRDVACRLINAGAFLMDYRNCAVAV